MKNAKLIILAAGLCMSVLTGCGSMTAKDPVPDTSPYVTDDLVNDMLPDMSDGEVKDTDGIIDENDTATGSDMTTNDMRSSAGRGMRNAKNAIGNAMEGAKDTISGMTDRG